MTRPIGGQFPGGARPISRRKKLIFFISIWNGDQSRAKLYLILQANDRTLNFLCQIILRLQPKVVDAVAVAIYVLP